MPLEKGSSINQACASRTMVLVFGELGSEIRGVNYLMLQGLFMVQDLKL